MSSKAARCSADKIFQASAQGFFDLAAADLFETLPQRRDRRHLLQRAQPTDKGLHLFEDDAFGLLGFVGAFLQIFLGDALKIVDVVKINVVEIINLARRSCAGRRCR